MPYVTEGGQRVRHTKEPRCNAFVLGDDEGCLYPMGHEGRHRFKCGLEWDTRQSDAAYLREKMDEESLNR